MGVIRSQFPKGVTSPEETFLLLKDLVGSTSPRRLVVFDDGPYLPRTSPHPTPTLRLGALRRPPSLTVRFYPRSMTSTVPPKLPDPVVYPVRE